MRLPSPASTQRRVRQGVLLLGGLLLAACSPKPETSAPACALEIGGVPAGGLRAFAVGYRIDMAATADPEAFRDSFVETFEQDLRPCLRDDAPNLLVYPEDLGLLAAFIGERAERARRRSRSDDAFIQLALAYMPVMNAYREHFGEISDARALHLAMGNVVWQTMHETFGEIARRSGAWTVASFNVPWPVRRSTDPAEVATFGDPLWPDVYVAETTAAWNLSAFFAPDGSLHAVIPKNYLVPAEEDLLELAWGPLREQTVLELPFSRVGSVISKDAWMPDVLRRLADLDARILVQPEAFSGWAVAEVGDEEWLPEVMAASAWAHSQAHPGFAGTIVPCLTGNLFELVFDCQSHIAAKAEPDGVARAFIGMDPLPGLVAVGEWAIADPIEAEPALDLATRRARLRAHGERLRHDGDLAGQYALSIAVADLALPEPGERPDRPQAVRAGDGTWIQGSVFSRPGTGAVLRLHEGDHSTPVFASGTGAHGLRLAADAERTAAVWAEGLEGREQLALALRDPDGHWRLAAAPATDPETIARWWPEIQIENDAVLLAWIEHRGNWSAVLAATGTIEDSGIVWQAPTRLDGKTAPLRGPRNNAFAPAVARRGDRAVVVWADFRDFSWDIYASISTDGTASWQAPVRVDDAGTARERLHGAPAAAITADGSTWIAWPDLRDRAAWTRIRVARAAAGESDFTVVDFNPGADRAQQHPHLATTADGQHLALAWQAQADGHHVLRFDFLHGAGLPAPPLPDPATPHWQPHLVPDPAGGPFELLALGRSDTGFAVSEP